MTLPFLFAEIGTVIIDERLPRLHRVGPSASLDKSEYLFLLLAAVYIMRAIGVSRVQLIFPLLVENWTVLNANIAKERNMRIFSWLIRAFRRLA